MNQDKTTNNLHSQGFSLKVTKTFAEPTGSIFKNFDLALSHGEIVSILGTSGCGKTTLLNLIAGLIDPDPTNDEGSNSHEIDFPESFSFAFQRANLIPWRTTTLNAYFETDLLSIDRELVETKIDSLINMVGLDSSRDLFPDELSVGMQQRLQLVRVIAGSPRLILLDEPLGAVDQPLRLEIAKKLRAFLKEIGSSVIWVTHDSLEAVTASDRVLVLGNKPTQILYEHEVNRTDVDERSEPKAPVLSRKTNPTIDEQAHLLREQLTSDHHLTEPLELAAEVAESIKPINNTQFREKHINQIFLPFLPLILLLTIWQISVEFAPHLQFYFSKPSEWIPRLGNLLITLEFQNHILVTLRETFIGVLIALPMGIIIGFITATSKSLTAMVRPSIVGLTAVPLFVLAPAFILWFGIGENMKIAIAALSCFPFIVYLVLDAALDVQGAYYRYLQKRGASSSKLFVHLLLPGALNGVLLSIRPAIVAALIGAFLGEFIAADAGLGYYIILQAGRYRMPDVIAGVSVLFTVALCIDYLFRHLAASRNFWISKTSL